MSEKPTVQAQLAAQLGASPGRGGAGIRRRLDEHGQPVCRLCEHPPDPEHPKSPYCAEHRYQARAEAQRNARLRQRVADGRGIVSDPVTGDLLLRANGRIDEVFQGLRKVRQTTDPAESAHALTDVEMTLYEAKKIISDLLGPRASN